MRRRHNWHKLAAARLGRAHRSCSICCITAKALGLPWAYLRYRATAGDRGFPPVLARIWHIGDAMVTFGNVTQQQLNLLAAVSIVVCWCAFVATWLVAQDGFAP